MDKGFYMNQIYDAKAQEAIIAQILPWLSEGKPLAEICRKDGMPHVATIWHWGNANPSLAQRIADAREIGGDKIANDCLAIADTKPKDMVDVQHRKLQIETRLKLLAKWHPKRYGDKLELSGEVNVTASPLAQLRTIVEARKAKAEEDTVIEAELVGDKPPALTTTDIVVSDDDCF